MPTSTERRILQRRNAKDSGAILVPILEELLEDEVNPDDDEDFAFIQMLLRVRAVPREKGVFSPSMLGSCLRQSYFAKRDEEKLRAKNPQTNGYFLNGNFVHFKWQFALFKAHRAGLLELVTVPSELPGGGYRLGVEVRVVDGDFGGTIDALVKIDGEVYVIDFKGINLIDFQRQVKRGAKVEYRRQIVGYAGIANTVLGLKVKHCLLVSECKAGPQNGRGSPLALFETKVAVKDFVPDVKRRLRTLRWYDHKDELPPPACVSTTHMGYQECAFNRFCTDEVKIAQRKRELKARGTKTVVNVARSGR